MAILTETEKRVIAENRKYCPKWSPIGETMLDRRCNVGGRSCNYILEWTSQQCYYIYDAFETDFNKVCVIVANEANGTVYLFENVDIDYECTDYKHFWDEVDEDEDDEDDRDLFDDYDYTRSFFHLHEYGETVTANSAILECAYYIMTNIDSDYYPPTIGEDHDLLYKFLKMRHEDCKSYWEEVLSDEICKIAGLDRKSTIEALEIGVPLEDILA